MTKFFLDWMNCFNLTEESYADLIEEQERPKEEDNKSRNMDQSSPAKDRSAMEMELRNQNNPDSMTQLNMQGNLNDHRSDLEAKK